MHRGNGPARAARFGLVGALVAASVVLSPVAAHAAPGEAHATAVDTDVVVTPAGTALEQHIVTRLAAVAAPPDASESIPRSTFQLDLGPDLGGVTDVMFFESLQTSASGGTSGTSASASVGRIEMGTTAGTLVIENVTASVFCPVGGVPSASAGDKLSVTLAGEPVALDSSGTTALDLSSGDNLFRLTLTTTASSDSGSATASGLAMRIEENLPGIIVADGTITFATASCESYPTRTTSGVIRDAKTGAPLFDACVVWSPVSAPGQNTVFHANGDGTFSFDTAVPGPINIGFFVPSSPGDCGSGTAGNRVPSWLDGVAFTDPVASEASAPGTARAVTPGTSRLVACLGTERPVASADCVTPNVTLSGRVVGRSGAPEQACIFVLGDEVAAYGPFRTAKDGTWSATGLPRNTPLAVGFIPYYEGANGPCANDGPPPVSPDGALQPVFYGDVWVDLSDPALFEGPRAWASAHGAALVTGTTTDVDGCLTNAPGSEVPRPACAVTVLPATGGTLDAALPIGLALVALGAGVVAAGRVRREHAP